MSAWLVSLSLMGLTVSYRHVLRRDLLSGLGMPFPRMMAHRTCHLEWDFDLFAGIDHANSAEPADHLLFVLSLFSPVSTYVDFPSKSYGKEIYSYPFPA